MTIQVYFIDIPTLHLEGLNIGYIEIHPEPPWRGSRFQPTCSEDID